MKNNLIGILLVLLGAVFFSAKSIFVKLAYQYPVDPLALLTLRMVFSLPFYGAVLLIAQSQKKGQPAPTGYDYLSVIFLGTMGYYLSGITDFAGLQYVSASMERLILFIYPTLVTVLGAFWFGRRIHLLQYGALALTYLGIGIALLGNHTAATHPQFAWGATLIFCTAFTYAIYLIGSEALIPKVGSTQFTAMAMGSAGVAVLIHYLSLHSWASLWRFPAEVYTLSFAIALISTVIPSFLVSLGIKRIGSGKASVVAAVGPISTIALAYIFLHEAITALQILGTGVVLVGVLLISWQKTPVLAKAKEAEVAA
ncbi:MAG TPA: hypothetical protein DCM08_04345 [Microscillaceae bacterium]|nr:hypothetical protein [Microscillaceae bacterium]